MREELFDELNGDIGIVYPTSGSTGKPKLVLCNFTKMIDAIFSNSSWRPMRTLLYLRTNHIGGINTILRSIASGSQVFVPKGRDLRSVFECVQEHKIECLPVNPSFLRLFLLSFDDIVANYDISSLKLITYGSEKMDEVTLSELSHRMPCVKFKQTYGLTETGILRTISKANDSDLLRIANDHRIVDGQLFVKSDDLAMIGYLNSDDPRDNGYMPTGDMVEQHEDGWIRILGRESDIINVGGEKVYPQEVEAVLMQDPSVIDCVVYGEKNSILGQIVCARIVTSDSAVRGMMSRYNGILGKLPAYKRPMRISRVDKIGYSENGKKIRKFTS